MKRIAFILTSLLVLSFGLANAQNAAITATLTAGGWGTDSLQTGVPVEWTIHYENTAGSNAGGITNGYSLTSAGTWSGLAMDTVSQAWDVGFDLGVFFNTFSITGSGADTVGFGGASIFGSGLADGFNDDALLLTTQFDNGQNGVQACLDSSFYPPGGSWLWSLGSGPVVPSWSGQMCYTLYQVPNLPPACSGGAGNLGALDHCVLAQATVSFTDPEGDPIISITQSTGPGTTDGAGNWSYAPSLADVGVSIPTVTITACDQFACGAPCLLDMSFSNQAPTIACLINTTFVGKGNPVTVGVTGNQVDCDPITYSLGTVTPAAVGTISVDPNTGAVTFATDDADGAKSFSIEVIVSDGDASASCNVLIDVLFTEPYSVTIEKTHGTIQGGHELVDLTLGTGSETMGGFDFLVAYDASALTFVGAVEGSIYAKCGWEYFTYRYGANGNCSGGCPSGLLRIVGIAETNNGANHPGCYLMETGDTFATMDFLVSDDRTLECQYVPIRFFWLDCGDNTISSETGDSLFISRFVYDFDLVGEITDTLAGYPTYQGAQHADCFGSNPAKVPVRFIDFYNGGIDIVCADSIDARGDINLNQISNEIADAVLFSNYFIHGLSVFTVNLDGQVAASDVNADGLTLSVADLVYLIRVIVGDALPYAKVSPVAASYSHDNNVLRVNSDMGAAYIVIEGNTVPTLLANNMEMRSNYDGANTRILVYSMEEGASFSGDFLNVAGDIISIEMATYDGAPVVAKEALPTAFSLQQNYPNPFNPTTKIGFETPVAGDYELSIYNVAGQKITSFNGFAEAGPHVIEWDAHEAASGIYFYRLDTQNFSATKKMVLLK